jgi:hypothetical protein
VWTHESLLSSSFSVLHLLIFSSPTQFVFLSHCTDLPSSSPTLTVGPFPTSTTPWSSLKLDRARRSSRRRRTSRSSRRTSVTSLRLTRRTPLLLTLFRAYTLLFCLPLQSLDGAFSSLLRLLSGVESRVKKAVSLSTLFDPASLLSTVGVGGCAVEEAEQQEGRRLSTNSTSSSSSLQALTRSPSAFRKMDTIEDDRKRSESVVTTRKRRKAKKKKEKEKASHLAASSCSSAGRNLHPVTRYSDQLSSDSDDECKCGHSHSGERDRRRPGGGSLLSLRAGTAAR